jgi:hypothetical protein
LLTAGSATPEKMSPKFGGFPAEDAGETTAPPPYSPSTKPGLSTLVAGKAKPPPPPKPKPTRLSGAPPPETVTALYDFAAQAEGDLSFRAGDVIEIIQRTQNENEWWQGKVNGKQGQFPGMLCFLCHCCNALFAHLDANPYCRKLCEIELEAIKPVESSNKEGDGSVFHHVKRGCEEKLGEGERDGGSRRSLTHGFSFSFFCFLNFIRACQGINRLAYICV